MPRRPARAVVVILWICAVGLLSPSVAQAWIENHVVSAETRVQLERDGKALIEQRLEVTTNGNQRLRQLKIHGVDKDVVPLEDSYVIGAREALGGSLDGAVPVTVTVKPNDLGSASLYLDVDDRKGLRRGRYLFVVRYQTDFAARGLLARDGGLTRVEWIGPRFDDGIDNIRAVFILPAAPTAPRAVEPTPEPGDEVPGAPVAEAELEGPGSVPSTYLSEVRRAQDHDEIELLRTYAPKDEGVRWAIRVDPRAVTAPVPEARPTDALPPAYRTIDEQLATPEQWLAAAGGVALLFLLLGYARAREVMKLAEARGVIVPPALPLPAFVRALGVSLGMTAGLALQLRFDKPLEGALAVLAAVIGAAHGVPRLAGNGSRGPGRWLNVSEREALAPVPREKGAWLDVSTRAGRVIFFLVLVGHGVATWLLSRHSFLLALQLGFDAVIWLSIFGLGRLATFPPDMAVEPARFFRALAAKLRKMKRKPGLDAAAIRLVPRIRIPQGEVDADELRLGIVPKLPLRGFGGIEVGLTYAVGLGARVAMPEILVRVVAGSPCDEALAAISARGRITPGRKPDERVIAISPRFPTPAMTASIVAALAARISDPAPANAAPTKRRRRARPKKARPAADEAAA